MDPNEVDFQADCAPAEDASIHAQFMNWCEEQLTIASAMATQSGVPAGAPHAEHSQPMATATVLPVEPFSPRSMPTPSRPYRQRYAEIGNGLYVRLGRRSA